MSNWLQADHDIVGLDVSKWQGIVNWKKMVATQANLGFAMCKATQGATFIDSKFRTNMQGMKQHLSPVSKTFGSFTRPIAVGTYHFANILPGQTDADYHAQADHYFNTVSGYNPDFWVLDWEDPRGHALSVNDRARYAKVFVLRLFARLKAKYGPSYVPKIFIYVGYYYWGNPDVNVVGNPYEWFGSYGPKLWIASYIVNNILPPAQHDYDIIYDNPRLNIPHFANGNHTWHVWQYTSSANVHGVNGKCDVSVARNSAIWNSDFYQ
jgi:GH25 family lysozyme M1 (1,4-beta-N-acetylmuramidase)